MSKKEEKEFVSSGARTFSITGATHIALILVHLPVAPPERFICGNVKLLLYKLLAIKISGKNTSGRIPIKTSGKIPVCKIPVGKVDCGQKFSGENFKG